MAIGGVGNDDLDFGAKKDVGKICKVVSLRENQQAIVMKTREGIKEIRSLSPV